MSDQITADNGTSERHVRKSPKLCDSIRANVPICYAALAMLGKRTLDQFRFIDFRVFAFVAYTAWKAYQDRRIYYCAFASHSIIARLLCSNRVSVYSALKRLESLDLITIYCRAKRNRCERNRSDTCRHRKAVALTYKSINLIAAAIALARGYKNAYAIAYNKANDDDVSRET